MATRSLEERIQLLEKSNEAQKKEIEHLRAVSEIANLMSRYEYMTEVGLFDDIVGLFAQKTPGVRAEISHWGVYEGIEGIRKLFPGLHTFLMDSLKSSMPSAGNSKSAMAPGIMFILPNTTPVIEVAGDGKTARGWWICTGLGTKPLKGELTAHWSWCKRGADFVKEDGEWKIWHYHVYGVFYTPYEKSWLEFAKVEDPNTQEILPPLPDELKADRPCTHPLWMYSPTAVVDDVPAPPEPYEMFDEKKAY